MLVLLLIGVLVLLLIGVLVLLLAWRSVREEERERARNERRYVRLSWDDRDKEDGWWRGL